MQLERLQIAFELTGHGWIDLHLVRGTKRHSLDGLSYLTPVLDDMLKAALPPNVGGRAVVVFALEPGQVRLICESRPDGSALLSVFDAAVDPFREPRPSQLHLEWQVGLESWDEFTDAVLTGAEALEASIGRERYARDWGAPFPVAELTALKRTARREN